MNYKKGDTFRCMFYAESRKLHVCGIIDGDMIVHKFYSRSKQRWLYNVSHESLFIRIVKTEK